MPALLFDTARFLHRLTSSGIPEGQARAVTEGLDDALRGAIATMDLDRQGESIRTEIGRLEAKIDGIERRLDGKIDGLGQRLDGKIEGVERRLEESIGRQIAGSQSTQLRWFVASLFGGSGLLFAALKLSP